MTAARSASVTRYCPAYKAVVLSSFEAIVAGCTMPEGHGGTHYDARQAIEWPSKKPDERTS